jgi:HPt (histidine-containing phosphotransfer) domain-containing protein
MLDFEVLKAFENVKSDDGSDILVELIDLYLHGTSQTIIAMRKAANEGEWALVKRAAHTVKGSTSTLGLHQITETCQDLEEASPSSTADAHILIDLLESKFLEVKPVLIAERNRRLTPPHFPIPLRR